MKDAAISPILSTKEIISLQKGRFKLDIIEMKLSRPSSDRIFTGNGAIYQDSDHSLHFTLYSTDFYNPEHAIKEIQRLSEIKLGEIIPDEEYYDLIAVDKKGRKWQARDITPDIRSESADNRTTCSGELRTITSEMPLPSNPDNQKNGVHILVNREFDFPLNRTTIIKGKGGVKRSIRNILYFKNTGIEFILERQEHLKMFSIKVAGDELGENIQTRTLETLQFVFAMPVLPIVIAQKSLYVNSISIISRRSGQTESRLHPPLRFDIHKSQEEFCNLFCKYFNFVSLHKKPGVHPISAQLNGVFYASAGYFENEAIALSVAIESILRNTFSTLGKPDKELKKKLNEAKTYIAKWSGDKNLITRIRGAIDAMKESRAMDKLILLESRGVITIIASSRNIKSRNCT